MSERLTNEQPQQRWRPFTRTAFRFAFVYLLLYNLPFPLNVFPYVDKVSAFYDSFWNWIVPRLGRAALHREVSTVVNGSGDRTYDFVLVACLLVISLVITFIWTIFDRKRPAYPTLYRWLNLYVRFVLGASMISYGAFKVITSQFPVPTLDRLMQSYGDSSPMGLLWTFMGASQPYTMFVGFAEMISGILLFSRKTATLGALMSIGVMSNVVALNFSYDVPVKLYSLHLLAMAIFLVLPDARRLANFLLLNRPVESVSMQPFFQRKFWHRGAQVFASLFLIGVISVSLYQSYDQRRSFLGRGRSPLYGVWEVEEFNVGQATATTSAPRWRRMVFDFPNRVVVQTAADVPERFGLELDQEKRMLTLRKRDDPNWNTVLTYEQVSPGVVTLAGAWNGLQLTARLHRSDERKFLLRDRGFHWINEFPFNR